MTEAADLQAMFDTLHASGAAERDPVRFAYLEALARRVAAQPEAIRRLLDARLSAAASELASRPATPPAEIAGTSTASPLAKLLAHISQHAHEPVEATETVPTKRTSSRDSKDSVLARPRSGPELRSVAWFHDTWSRLSTEQQLTQTLAQAPENAGPMNSQHLVLRSLQVMRDIAPDYLQGFMSYVDTLIWLEHADPTKPAAGRSSVGERENKARTAKRSAAKR